MSRLPDLEWESQFSTVTFCDERTGGRHPGAVASVTLTSKDGDESWGEFLDANDALALRSWLDELIARL